MLSTKKVLYLVNMSSRDYLRSGSSQHPTVLSVQQMVEFLNGDALKDMEVFPISLAFEDSLRRIEKEEGLEAIKAYHDANPTHISALDTILIEAHRALSIIHFYTANELQVKCWCLKQGKTILDSCAIVDVTVARYM